MTAGRPTQVPSETATSALGRPTTFTPENADQILERISEGESLTDAAQSSGVCRQTFYRWMSDHSDLRNAYAHAREVRADWYADKLIELADQCAAGELDPQSAKVAIDAYKWITCRLHPKSYGDKQSVEISKTHTPEDLERLLEQQGMKRLSDAIPE